MSYRLLRVLIEFVFSNPLAKEGKMGTFLRITPAGTTTDFFFNSAQIAEVKVDDETLVIKLSTGDVHKFSRKEVPEPALNKFMSELMKR